MKLLLPMLLLTAGTGSAAAAAGWSWQSTPDSVALRQDQQTVWQFNFGTNETKPCFHPVALPGGPVLTWYRPPDHPWHRALWFSWKFINGVNYWEENPKTGLAAGRTEWNPPARELRPNFSARLVLDLTYRPENAQPVMTEHRAIECAPPDERGFIVQDWTLTFTALGSDVFLDRTPLPNEPGGQVYGGYAGLSVRLVQEMGDVRLTAREGPIAFTAGRYRGQASALDYAGTIDGRAAGVAILDHPENLNAPSPWYAINDNAMRYFSPAVICYQPHTLKAGRSLTLRYRVIAHPGRWDAAKLQSESKRYLGQQKLSDQ